MQGHNLVVMILSSAICCTIAWSPPCPVSSLSAINARSSMLRRPGTGIMRKSICSKLPFRASKRVLAPSMMAGFVEQVDSEGLEIAMQETDGPMVIDFFATWCGPCVMLAPQLEKVADDYKGKVRFLKVDTDQNEAIASAMKIFGLPTLLFIKEGKVLKRIEGALMANKLREVCDFLFFGGPKPVDDVLRNLLEDDLMV